MDTEYKKYDDNRLLPEIAQDIISWCLSRGCQKLGETSKEFRVTCPNGSCPSREKPGEHKSFDINKNLALYHCFHCGLSGVGLHGSKGLIAQLESGDFSPSAFSFSKNASANFESFKPKKEAEPIMSKDELPSIAKAICKEAQEYFAKRGIPEYVYRDTDLRIFSAPAGTQFSFMKQPLSEKAIFFPIRNGEGEVIHVHYKLLRGGYYMSPGPKPVYQTKKTALNNIAIVEGVFDALSVYTAGYSGAALLGHEITGNHDLSIFKDKPVVIMLDNDDAGKASVNSVASVLAKVAAEVKIATIPSELGKDANDVLVKAGVEKLSELIQNAVVYEANAESEPTTEEQETTMSDEQQAESQEQTTAKKESANDSLTKKINEIRASKTKVFIQRRAISNLVINNLISRGYFCRTPIGELYYFDESAKELFELSDLDFHARLSRWYDMNPSEREFDFVIVELENLTRLDGKRVDVYRFAHFDTKQNALYVYNNAHQIYRLNGSNITLIDNGTENILFLKNPLGEPFEYNHNSIQEGLFKKVMVDSINFTKGASAPLQPEEQRRLHECYFYSLFFPELLPAKPIEVLVGDKGSGKSVCQRKRGKLLYGKRFNLKPIATDREDAFIATITNNHLASFDNVDGKISWLNDHLASASTGEEISRRKLYTTNEEINYPVNCFITLNTRTPQFKRPDVVDRSLILRTETIELKKSEGEIYQEVAEKRNALWSELLEKLNLIVATIQSNQEAFTTQHRMADWARLAWNVAKAEKKETEFLSTLDRLNRAQSDFLLEDDSLFTCLLVWLENPNNVGKEVASGTLYNNLQFIATQGDLDFAFKNSKTFGRRLKQLFPAICEALKDKFLITQTVGKTNNLTTYKFDELSKEKVV